MRCKDERRKKDEQKLQKVDPHNDIYQYLDNKQKKVSLGRWKNNLKKTTFSNFHVSRFNSHVSSNPIEVTITETNYVFSIHEFFMQTIWQLSIVQR